MNREILNTFYGKEKWDTYKKFQQIENDIQDNDYLYNYFDEIKEMLLNEKSYIKVRGFRIICQLSKWDKDNKINDSIDILLDVLNDDKPTNVRQCLSALNILLLYKPELSNIVIKKIVNIDCSKYKNSMSPLIKKDIDYILKQAL